MAEADTSSRADESDNGGTLRASDRFYVAVDIGGMFALARSGLS
jgi:hypothetical protein